MDKVKTGSRFDALLGQGVFLDIEAGYDRSIREIGFAYGSTTAIASTQKDRQNLYRTLEEIAQEAEFIGGHNIIWHDLPLLAKTRACPHLLNIPVIDTLLLSPLAFPQKPYHRLVKNDKIVASARSNPLNDAQTSRKIAADALTQISSLPSDEWSMLAAFLKQGDLPENAKRGLHWISRISGHQVCTIENAIEQFVRSNDARFCSHGWDRLGSASIRPPQWAALAFFASWLRIAGSDSIVPPWVRKQFPEVATIFRELRSTPCGKSHCAYCAETHDPVRQLQKFFQFEDFRPEPHSPGNPNLSLQHEIVRMAMADNPLLAILPTGGGKSLCFQLPALQRYYRDGSLTVVISPLQALMKDQVDNLASRTGVRCVGALHGMLTPPERGELLEELQLGGIGIVYVSPEQLRNPSFRNAIKLRQMAYWVCDEAHCISKWGHDFRPDYLYISRFIRELSEDNGLAESAPVLCLTATAKEDVKDEIRQHFKQELGQELMLFDGGAERSNLSYQVEPVDVADKAARIHEILTERLANTEDAAVVFVATQKHAETTAEILKALRWKAEYFHAGLESERKKSVLDQFIAGELQVICATNAFGMGIDKENIRVVIHADVPGSLENYLQEAGRAGRDRKPADCILLYNESDLESQFRLGSFSKIHESDIRKILKALRSAERKTGIDGSVCLSARELMYGCQGGTTLEHDPPDTVDTKVKTAIAVLEEGSFLARNDNLTRVFQGRPLIQNMDEAGRLIAALNLSPYQQELWHQIIRVFLELPENAANAMERFTEVPALARIYEKQREEQGRFWNRYRPVFDTLNDMADAGLIKKDLLMSAVVNVDSKGSSDQKRSHWITLEKSLLDKLRELDPDIQGPVPLNIRKLNTELSRDLQAQTLIDDILIILELWKRDRSRIDGGASAFLYKKKYKNYLAELPNGWEPIAESVEIRQNAGSVILNTILDIARQKKAKGKFEVEFAESDLIKSLQEEFAFAGQPSKSLARMIRFILVSLHDQGILVLKNGKALFTQSMNIKLTKDNQGRYSQRFRKSHFDTLEIYYQEKNFQLHVMAEYAKLGTNSLTSHLKLIRDYFHYGNTAFARKYFAGRSRELELATGMESYRLIVECLANKPQQEIVASRDKTNMLVLAGPGSGKSRVVSHRCAYLLRVLRVRPQSILVVCFNRHACISLRQRIQKLIGDDARGVTIQTYHGLALTLLGKTLLEDRRSGVNQIDFNSLITDATERLRSTVDNEDPENTLRGRLIRGYQHILVDEYQDISENEYNFLSEIAGRTIDDADQKISILAVGDDDQSIYGFKGANITFLQRFQKDYNAEVHYLVQNFRSTKRIIQASNQFIAKNRDRMKTGHEIRICDNRQGEPDGGIFEELDRYRQGRVKLIELEDESIESLAVLEEIEEIRKINPEASWSQFAVVSRLKVSLHPIRSLLEDKGIPVDWRADDPIQGSLFRIREVFLWLHQLRECRSEMWTVDTLAKKLDHHICMHGQNNWTTMLYDIGEEWKSTTGDMPIIASMIHDHYVESLAMMRNERKQATGVVIANAHKVKGLEFPHVVVLSGGWKFHGQQTETEEERRLYYVAMTRAMNTLTLFQSTCNDQPLRQLRDEGSVLHQKWRPAESQNMQNTNIIFSRYEQMTLEDIFIDYARRFLPSAKIHQHIARLKTGDRLELIENNHGIFLRDNSEIIVAKLSKAGVRKWAPRKNMIQSIQITAIVTRLADDNETDTTPKTQCDSWEIPLVEITWSTSMEQLS